MSSLLPSLGIWRPPQWNGPAMVSITIPSPPQAQVVQVPITADNYVPGTPLDVGGSNTVYQTINTPPTTYVFDAVLDLEHEQRLEKTHHPVQTGADLSSHAYLMPARLVMYVGMSDAMDAYSAGADPAQPPYIAAFTGAPFGGSGVGKSVYAYQQMLTLQAARQPLTVTTRLRTYTNMIITSVSPREDFKTITGLRMRIEFEQIFTSSTADVPNSVRSNSTDSTGLGTVNPTTVPTPTQTQFQIPQAPATGAAQPLPLTVPATQWTTPANDLMTNYLANVPGSGSYASVPGQLGLPK